MAKTEKSARWMRAVVGLLVAGLVVGGCGSGGDSEPGQDTGATTDTGGAAVADTTGGGDDVPSAATVTLSGVAYVFNTPNPRPGVTIRIAEYPDISAVSDETGRFSMLVPDGATITPIGERDGFAKMHLQTFTTNGEDITSVYLQMVPEGTYDMFAAILGITPSDEHCQISTTVSEKVIQGMTYEEFAAHGHHGVGEATVTTEPAVPDLVYFDATTTPDRSLTETSRDGGVVCTNVPPGIYVFTVHHATRDFETFTATCEPGRFINANPPWGLREK